MKKVIVIEMDSGPDDVLAVEKVYAAIQRLRGSSTTIDQQLVSISYAQDGGAEQVLECLARASDVRTGTNSGRSPA